MRFYRSTGRRVLAEHPGEKAKLARQATRDALGSAVDEPTGRPSRRTAASPSRATGCEPRLRRRRSTCSRSPGCVLVPRRLSALALRCSRYQTLAAMVFAGTTRYRVAVGLPARRCSPRLRARQRSGSVGALMRVVHVHRIARDRRLGAAPADAAARARRARRRGAFAGLDDPGCGPDPFYEALEAPRRAVPARRATSPGLARTWVGRCAAPDLVHTHLVHADVYGALACAAGTPLVSTKHNDDPFRAGPFRFVERLLARRAARIVAITESLAPLHSRAGRPAGGEGRGHPLRPGRAAGRRGRANELELPDGDVSLAVARLVPQKGLDVAVEALGAGSTRRSSCSARGPSADGSRRRRVRSACACCFPGRVGDVAAVLRRADAARPPCALGGLRPRAARGDAAARCRSWRPASARSRRSSPTARPGCSSRRTTRRRSARRSNACSTSPATSARAAGDARATRVLASSGWPSGRSRSTRRVSELR